MKATDFNFENDLSFDLKKGLTTFRDTRIVMFDANAIGLLRQETLRAMGKMRTREVLLRFGYQQGFSDFIQMKMNYEFENEMELLASGPVIHTWEGIVQATPTKIEYDREKGTFFFTGVWTNSYEAEQHLSFNEEDDEPVCWTLMGYASGWCTAFFGKPLLAIEPVCAGKGDDHCEWKIMPPENWGDEAKVYVDALKSFWKEA